MADVLATSGIIAFTGLSRVDPQRRLVVRYPDAFPSMPPLVFDDGSCSLLQRHHQPTTREFCLFGPQRQRWSAQLSGTAAIDEAEAVIALFQQQALPAADDLVPEPATALYDYTPDAAFLVPPPITMLAIGSEQMATPKTVRLRFRRIESPVRESEVPGRGIVLETNVTGSTVKADEPFRHWHSEHGQEVVAPLQWLAHPPPQVAGRNELNAWLAKQGVRVRDRNWTWMAFVFPEQSVTAATTRLGWLVLHAKHTGKLLYVQTYPYRATERAVRVPGMGGLNEKRVVFIGCGSLGSKIAVALAATGVNHFGLVDYDMMEPDNPVRHEAGVEQYGTLKVVAVYQRLCSINPQARATLLPMRIGSINPLALERQLYEMIGSADLVVDTTGAHGVSRFINDVCAATGSASLYASVTNGAWSGEIVRVIPRQSACWRCWFEQYELDVPPAEPAPKVGVFAPGCAHPTFTGTTYDVGIVANLAASMAVETLLRRESERANYGGDYVRWSMRNHAGQREPMLNVLSVERRNTCPICNPT